MFPSTDLFYPSRLFTWIVGHVNAAIDPSLTDNSSALLRNPSVIGVLDIYGFEVRITPN